MRLSRSRSTSSGRWSRRSWSFGRPYHFGLEAGSKPELLAVIAMAGNDVPIVCNGFKDDEFIEMALLAQKIGRQIFLVVEKYTELELILQLRRASSACGPQIGIRVKLASPRLRPLAGLGRATARSSASPVSEILRALAELKAARHGGLLQAAPLPPRQPDHQHPPHQAAR